MKRADRKFLVAVLGLSVRDTWNASDQADAEKFKGTAEQASSRSLAADMGTQKN